MEVALRFIIEVALEVARERGLLPPKLYTEVWLCWFKWEGVAILAGKFNFGLEANFLKLEAGKTMALSYEGCRESLAFDSDLRGLTYK